MKKISIIILSYNHEKFITKNLESIFMQIVDTKVEVIICDDHSLDDTDVLIKRLIQNIPANFEVKYTYQKENIGATPNFYFAMNQVTGDYLAFCEGDDYWTNPKKLQTQLNFLEKNIDYSMCFHAAKNISTDPAIDNTLFSKISDRDYNQEEIYKHWKIHTATVMMRKTVLSSDAKLVTMKDNDLQYFDTVLFLAAGTVGKIYGSSSVMSAYRRHDLGISADKVNFKRDLLHNKLDRIIGNYYKDSIKKIADWQIFMRSYNNSKIAFLQIKWIICLNYLPWLLRNKIWFYYIKKKLNYYDKVYKIST